MNQVAHQVRAYLGFSSIKQRTRSIFCYPLDRMLAHLRVTPSSKFAITYSYAWVERGTVRGKCLVLEHDTMSLVRVLTPTATGRSWSEHTSHEATMTPFS